MNFLSIMFMATSVLFTAFISSDFLGKLLFVALLALSLTTWFVLLHKVWLFKHVRKESYKLQEVILERKDIVLHIPKEELYSLASYNPFAMIYGAIKVKTIEILDKNHFFGAKREENPSIFLSRSDIELIDTHSAIAITKEWKTLEKNLSILSTSVTLAPFLGILGTVWGILISLSELNKGASQYSNAIVLSGLSTALATTVLGLIIAIPALVAHSYLKSSLRSYTSEMRDFSTLLLSEIELQYRKVD